MSAQNTTRRTRILLSFSRAYAELAQRIENDLCAANIEVRYDQWEGGGGVPSTQSVPTGVDDATFVLPLLTPSDVTPSWIGEEWRRTIYDEACVRRVGVLPVRGDGDLHAVPDFLREISFANLRDHYAPELRRLIETVRKLSGDASIQLPPLESSAGATLSSPAGPAHPLTLEVGAALAHMADENAHPFLREMVPMMHDGLFYEMGVRFPELHLGVAPDLPPASARVVINGIPEVQLEVRSGSVMVNETVGEMAERGISGELAINPANGCECAWIPEGQAAAARDCGLTTWDTGEFLILSLSAVLRHKAANFIGIAQAQAMLEQLEPVFPKLVSETVPKTVSLFVLTEVLRRLVAEEISIRNLRRILMALAEWGRLESDPLYLAEYARASLKREITYKFSRGARQLFVFLLDPAMETLIRDSKRQTATSTYVHLEPESVRKILEAIQRALAAFPNGYQMPEILTTMEIRSFVRRLVARSMPHLHVLCYQEITPEVKIIPITRIALDGFTPYQIAPA